MARSSKIRWNVSAFEELRRSAGVERELSARVGRVLEQVGDGYDGGVEPGRTRSRGYVVTATPEAMRAEASDHRLLSALGGGSS